MKTLTIATVSILATVLLVSGFGFAEAAMKDSGEKLAPKAFGPKTKSSINSDAVDKTHKNNDSVKKQQSIDLKKQVELDKASKLIASYYRIRG